MLLNTTTKNWLDSFTRRPRAALLIDSPNDRTSAIELAEHVYKSLIEDKSNPLLRLTLTEKKSIGVEEIRVLQRMLQNKADRTKNDISRVALIEYADKMTVEAQNALLKLLEELPDSTVLILACSNRSSMLKTVLSRCFLIPILPITIEQAETYASSQNIDNLTMQKAYMMSEGKSSLFLSILHDRENTIKEVINLAKSYMQSTIVERQKLNDAIIKDTTDIYEFLSSLELVTKVAMRNAKNIHNKTLWKDRLKLLLEIKTQLDANVSTKLVLLNLSVSL